MNWLKRTLRTTVTTIFGIGVAIGFLAMLLFAMGGWAVAVTFIANGLYIEGIGALLLWAFCLAGMKELK